jgi:hypothetical protein
MPGADQVICPTGAVLNFLSSGVRKNFPLRDLVEAALLIPVIPARQEGRIASRHGRGQGCGGRGSVGAKWQSQGGFP